MVSAVCRFCSRKFSGRNGLNIHLSLRDVCALRYRGAARTEMFSGTQITGNKRLRLNEMRPPVTQIGNDYAEWSFTGNEDVENEHLVSENNGELDDNDGADEFFYGGVYELPDSGDTYVEGVSQTRNHKYNSGLELMYGLMTMGKYRGLSYKDMNTLLKILHHPSFSINEVPFRTAEQFNGYLKKFRNSIFGECVSIYCEAVF